MNFKNYYANNETFITETDIRLKKIIQHVEALKPSMVLDIGCGSGYLLGELSKKLSAKYYGVDVYEGTEKRAFNYVSADITEGLPFKSKEFDCVILGEVIEHVPNPDELLREIKRVMQKDAVLIVTTPNLVSWANRLFVLFGIQPLFTETSSERNLGRRFKLLGQGGKVQGHLKIFTYNSLKEILEKEGFKIIKREGVPFFFPAPILYLDRFFTHFTSLTSGLLYIAVPNDEPGFHKEETK